MFQDNSGIGVTADDNDPIEVYVSWTVFKNDEVTPQTITTTGTTPLIVEFAFVPSWIEPLYTAALYFEGFEVDSTVRGEGEVLGAGVHTFDIPTFNGQVFDEIRFTVETDNNNQLPIFRMRNFAINHVCVRNGTLVSTPDGKRAIEDICVSDPVHLHSFQTGTVSTEPVARVSTSPYLGGDLVRIPAGALSEGLPRRDIILTVNHPIMHAGSHYDARALVGIVPGVEIVPHDADTRGLYNLTFATEGAMVIEGGVLAHTIPPLSFANALDSVSTRDDRRTDLLVADDGRTWHRMDGAILHNPGPAGGHWV